MDVKASLGLAAAFVFSAGVFAWLTILPVLGGLWLVGALK